MTKKTRDLLIADFADNTSGNITEGDGRNHIESWYRANTVRVNGSDGDTLPATLADNTLYLIDGAVTQTSAVTAGVNNVVAGFSTLQDSITYTGTGDMIDVGTNNLTVRDFTFSSASGDLVGTANGGGANLVAVINVATQSVNQLLALTSVGIVFLNQVQLQGVTGNGIIMGGTNGRLFMIDSIGTIVSGIGAIIELGGATFAGIKINNSEFDVPSGATAISGAASSGNLQSGAIGTVNTCAFVGDGDALSGITPQDLQWDFNANTNVIDSVEGAWMQVTSNATNTTLAADTPTLLLSASWTEVLSSRMSVNTSTGEWTFNGLKETFLRFTIRVTGEKVGGGQADSYTIEWRLNGSPVTGASTTRDVDNSGGDFEFPALIDIFPSDNLQLYVTANGHSNNFLMTSCDVIT